MSGSYEMICSTVEQFDESPESRLKLRYKFTRMERDCLMGRRTDEVGWRIPEEVCLDKARKLQHLARHMYRDALENVITAHNVQVVKTGEEYTDNLFARQKEALVCNSIEECEKCKQSYHMLSGIVIVLEKSSLGVSRVANAHLEKSYFGFFDLCELGDPEGKQ